MTENERHVGNGNKGELNTGGMFLLKVKADISVLYSQTVEGSIIHISVKPAGNKRRRRRGKESTGK